MTVWIKQGVTGILSAPAQKGLGRIALLYTNHKLNLFITSICEGTHSAGSLHYNGNAFDFRKHVKITKKDIKFVLGKQFDVVIESNHIHVEFDPKED